MEEAVVLVYTSGAGLNETGNTVLAAHNYSNGTLFSNNKNLEIGDLIYITDSTGRTITYEVYDKYETELSDSDYMARRTYGVREISLSTCTDDEQKRLIVLARET